MGFTKDYWEENYADLEEMDGIVNAHIHAQYVKSFFSLEYIEINSVIDLGFGLGHLFKEIVKTFEPSKVCGIEPSSHGMEEFKKRERALISDFKIKLYEEDLFTWSGLDRKSKSRFDLGICTSVLQYVKDEDLKKIIPVLASRIKYLYLSVPTDKELKRQVSELGFHDKYALRRSRKFYYDLLSKDFAFIGSRLLESKHYFSEETTEHTDLLFRF